MIKHSMALSIILMILGLSITAIDFIPSWEKIEMYIFLLIWLGAVWFGILYLSSCIEYTDKSITFKKTINWFKHIFLSIALTFSLILTLIVGGSNIGKFFFGPVLDRIERVNKDQFIIYNNYCFPPDNTCECDFYYSLIYKQNSYLPVMHLKGKPNFYAGKISIVDNTIIVHSSEMCTNDEGAKIEYNL